MNASRRSLLMMTIALALFAACGSQVSTLHAKGKASGDGPAHLDIQNNSGVQIIGVYMAKTEAVDKAREAGVDPGSNEDRDLWGEDWMGRASLFDGKTLPVGDVEPGRYDVLVTDPDGREQLVKGLKLKAGGKYVLELFDSGWQLPN